MGIDRDVWLKALATVGCDDATDDRDAITVDEFATMIGIARMAASRRLDRLVAHGAAVKTKKWGNSATNGRRQQMIAYRLTTPPAPKRKR